jgi:hypothetical protein
MLIDDTKIAKNTIKKFFMKYVDGSANSSDKERMDFLQDYYNYFCTLDSVFKRPYKPDVITENISNYQTGIDNGQGGHIKF